MTEFKIAYSQDGVEFQFVQKNGADKVVSLSCVGCTSFIEINPCVPQQMWCDSSVHHERGTKARTSGRIVTLST